MEFDRPLLRGILLRRYKRFFADVTLEDDRIVTAHCANTGAMLGVAEPGFTVWVEPNNNPKRKLRYSWKLVEIDGAMVGIDTGVPNKVVGDALRSGKIPEVADYPLVRAEVKYAGNSRVDFLLSGTGKPDLYLEVKNVHLRRDADWAEFPDTVTSRGAKHLGDLTQMVREGHRAMMFYFIHRGDCARLKMASDLDPTYADALSDAVTAGVEVLAYDTHVTVSGITLAKPIPVAL